MFDTIDGDVDPGIHKLQINFPVGPYLMYLRKLHAASRYFCNLLTGKPHSLTQRRLVPMVFALKKNRHRKSNGNRDRKT